MEGAHGRVVFAAVRRYVGLDSSLIDVLAANATAICDALTSAPGSVGCEVIATREGLLVVSTGIDEATVAESGRRFVAWLDRHLPDLRDTNPEVWAGTVLVHGAAARTVEGGTS
jgi:hypothetical protein